MKVLLGILPAAGLAAALVGAAGAQPSGARATLFDQPNFQGSSITVVEGSPDLSARGFAGRAMSGRFEGDWTLCDSPGLDGRCASVSGDVTDLAALGLGRRVVSLREAEEADRYAPSDRRSEEYAGDGRDGSVAPDDADDERVPGPSSASATPATPPTGTAAAPPSYAAAPLGADASAPPAPTAAATVRNGAQAGHMALTVSRSDGDAGRSAVFFARPQRAGADIDVDVQGPANQFCRDQGLGRALYYDTDGRDLRNVLCQRN